MCNLHEPVRKCVTQCASSPEKTRTIQNFLFGRLFYHNNRNCQNFSLGKIRTFDGVSQPILEDSEQETDRYSVTQCASSPEKTRTIQNFLFGRRFYHNNRNCQNFF
jgi:hypothetical protein